MNIAVLVFGQFRAANELLENNIIALKKGFAQTNTQFDVYILTDKLDSGNYSKESETFVKGMFAKHQMNLYMLEYWENFQDCYIYEELLNNHLNTISNQKLSPREVWAASLWYRRYILWKQFEQVSNNKNRKYETVLFTRIFDTSIECLKPLLENPVLTSTLFFSIDTLFYGSFSVMKELFKFGSSINNWKNFTWTPEFTEAFAKFDICLSQTKPTFSSEAQIFHYIYTNIKKYKNIRYDFNTPASSPTNVDAYFHVKIQRANIIPKRILQIAIGDAYVGSLPLEDVKQHILQNHNTEYEYALLTDDACKKFLKDDFPEYSSLYTRLQKPQYKSDLIRYLYLYKNGGYYIDIDLLPLLPLYTIFEAAKSAPLFFTVGAHTNSKKNTFELCNGFIGAKPGNPIFLELVKLMEQEPNPEDYGMNVKRLYKTIASRHSMTPFQTENSIYLFREVQHMGKYYIVNKKEIIVHSNGHGYPQKKV